MELSGLLVLVDALHLFLFSRCSKLLVKCSNQRLGRQQSLIKPKVCKVSISSVLVSCSSELGCFA